MVKGFMRAGRRAAAPQLHGMMLALVCGVAGVGCHRAVDTSSGIQVKEDITPQPVRVGPAAVSVELSDASRKPVSHAAIMVEADMSHPGMSPVFAEAKETAPGLYRAQFEFSMAGDWVMLLHVKLADGRRIERQMDVRGVQPN